MNIGVILSRCQPLHKGHIEMINRALAENDKVLFIIGSADKSGTERNPFPIGYRISMLKFALSFVKDKNRVDYMILNDWSSLVSAWFPKSLRNRITIVSYPRIDDISSSSIRKAIIENYEAYVEKCIPYWQGVRLRNMMKRYKSILNKED